MKIGIIGAGNVGATLGTRLAKRGHEIKFGLRKPIDEGTRQLLGEAPGSTAGSNAEAATFADVLLLATPWSGVEEAIQSAGDLSGKTLLDATNPLEPDLSWLEIGHITSGAEKLQAWAPGAHVVKVFNTTGFNIMANPRFGAESATMFYCGDHPPSKGHAALLANELEFDAVDAGPLEQARLLEALAWLWITLALKYGQGREIAFKLLRR